MRIDADIEQRFPVDADATGVVGADGEVAAGADGALVFTPDGVGERRFVTADRRGQPEQVSQRRAEVEVVKGARHSDAIVAGGRR